MAHKSTPKNPSYADCVSFPQAMEMLRQKHNATKEDVAGWVVLGEKDGGLNAYVAAADDTTYPFYFAMEAELRDKDYFRHLMKARFVKRDIEQFEPEDRFISGAALIERWSDQPDISVRDFIRQMIGAGKLLDLHPTCGATNWMHPNDHWRPPGEDALFEVASVEYVEESEFVRPHDGSTVARYPPVSQAAIMAAFVVKSDVDENSSWWAERLGHAKSNGLIECRVGRGKVGRTGGSLWRADLIAGWLVDKAHLGKGAVKAALARFDGYADSVDEVFPED